MALVLLRTRSAKPTESDSIPPNPAHPTQTAHPTKSYSIQSQPVVVLHTVTLICSGAVKSDVRAMYPTRPATHESPFIHSAV